MLVAAIEKYTLHFKQASGTSRGVLTEKDSWFLRIWNKNKTSVVGIGEASIIKSLSPDWSNRYEAKLDEVAQKITYYANHIHELVEFPSIQFAIETALLDLKNGGHQVLFPSDFTTAETPITINGLIWMGSEAYMHEQIEEKIAAGFKCIKLKIGAIDFKRELHLLAAIRKRFSKEEIELRVDANGAFAANEALEKLRALAEFNLHSIEQPIKQGQLEAMSELCKKTPLPIALDEELIGIYSSPTKNELLERIQPQYIILKPSLIGGFAGTNEWIAAAEKQKIQWWITSALESNVGLNAIAQYTFTKNNLLPQGLGTGQLYTNNTPSNLTIKNGQLFIQN